MAALLAIRIPKCVVIDLHGGVIMLITVTIRGRIIIKMDFFEERCALVAVGYSTTTCRAVETIKFRTSTLLIYISMAQATTLQNYSDQRLGQIQRFRVFRHEQAAVLSRAQNERRCSAVKLTLIRRRHGQLRRFRFIYEENNM